MCAGQIQDRTGAAEAFAILTIGGALRSPEGSLVFGKAKPKIVAPTPVPTV